MMHGLGKALLAAMTSWHRGKLFIEHLVTLSHDSIHIIAGLLLWIIAGALLRRPLTSWAPWLCALAAIMWNESVDLVVERWPERSWQYGEGAKDVLLTMFVPTVIMLAARLRPELFNGGGRRSRRR